MGIATCQNYGIFKLWKQWLGIQLECRLGSPKRGSKANEWIIKDNSKDFYRENSSSQSKKFHSKFCELFQANW